MLFKTRKAILLKAALVLTLAFALPSPSSSSTCSGYTVHGNCSQSCYNEVYCEAIACFQDAWAQGQSGDSCCYYNTYARFCGQGCPRFCAAP
jgi:hypothetical protein